MSGTVPEAASRCLTAAEIAAVRAATPGKAPAGLAAHLASCERCQRRALFGFERGDAPRKRRDVPALPSARRAVVMALAVLAALAAALYSLRLLAGPGR
jgi:hypothetical protein